MRITFVRLTHLAVILGLLLSLPMAAAQANDPPAEYDCTDVGEGETCDAENPDFSADSCIISLDVCRTIIIVDIGTTGAEDFRTAWGTPVTPNAWANAKDTRASTGFATEVQIVTKMDWNNDFHGIYDNWDQAEGFDRAEFWSDFNADGITLDQDPKFLRACFCTGVYGTSDSGTGALSYTSAWLPTNWPSGVTYESQINVHFIRFVDTCGNDGFDECDRREVDLKRDDLAHITVGDLL